MAWDFYPFFIYFRYFLYMSKDPNKRPIIIKKVKKISGGHHGGAWKVAYADFVTAMMAFFLLLWLLAQAPKEKLKGLADYFTPTVGIQAKSGVQLKGASADVDNGIKTKPGAMPSVMPGAPPTTGDTPKAPESDEDKEADFDSKPQLNLTQAEAAEADLEKKRFEQIKKELNDAMEKDPTLKAFKDNLKIKETPEGLQIEITDLDGVSMFEIGSPKLRAETQPLLTKVSQAIQKVDNKVAIIGHTDALSYKNNNGYSNWELSADRANASRRFLTGTGLDEKRISKVEGKANRDPLDKEKPDAAQNRRISIILLKKSIAPVDDKNSKAPDAAAPTTSPTAPAPSSTPASPSAQEAPAPAPTPAQPPADPALAAPPIAPNTAPIDSIPSPAVPAATPTSSSKPDDNKPTTESKPSAALPASPPSMASFTIETPNIPKASQLH